MDSVEQKFDDLSRLLYLLLENQNRIEAKIETNRDLILHVAGNAENAPSPEQFKILISTLDNVKQQQLFLRHYDPQIDQMHSDMLDDV